MNCEPHSTNCGTKLCYHFSLVTPSTRTEACDDERGVDQRLVSVLFIEATGEVVLVRELVFHQTERSHASLVLAYIESENRYLVKIPQGETLFVAAETSSVLQPGLGRKVVLDAHADDDSFEINFVQWEQSVENMGDGELLHQLCVTGASVLTFLDV
uniref:Uncharacterized protein n=1 Tax=Timema monikensis TaxID=170555 RepID=A0A7R9EHL9_9NEOP|nr:unnamed protein product [Timema monikensis]